MARLAYEEVVRRISTQRQVLSDVRTRVGTLFGAASLATSFLSSVAAGSNGLTLGFFGWAGVALFGLVTAVTMAMFGTARLFFSIPHTENVGILEMAPDPAGSAADTYREFANRLERRSTETGRRMRPLFAGMSVLCFLVGAELIAWTIEFAS